VAPPLADYRAPLDLDVFRLLNRDGGALLDTAARVLSSTAFGVAAGLAAAALLWRRLGRAALRPVAALGLAVALADALGSQLWKRLLARRRPCYALPEGEVRRLLAAADASALPSLHAANLFALATVAALADRRLALPGFAVAAAVALSRVYGGVHWPSDVVAGALWGALCGLAAWAAARASAPAPPRPAARPP
jgi:undecaprenyl-diphosphatase